MNMLTQEINISECNAVEALENVIKKPRTIETELGTEKLCRHCDEYWPLDDEFWYFTNKKNSKGIPKKTACGACKGCYMQAYKPQVVTARKARKSIKSSYEVAA